MKHLMLDLETLGTKPGCVILSIGAVMFDLETGALGKEFYVTIDLKSSLKAGFQIEADTLKWWMQQDKTVADKLFIDAIDLDKALDKFIMFWYDEQPQFIWGNGISFDGAILATALHKQSINIPWGHRNERDMRTLVGLFGEQFGAEPIRSVGAHDPIVDCLWQIVRVTTIYNSLMKSIKP